MKKLLLALALLCAVTAVWPALALAQDAERRVATPLASPQPPANGVHFSAPPALRLAVPALGPRARTGRMPRAMVSGERRDVQGACTVTGQVLNDEGTVVSGADVTLVYLSGTTYYTFGARRTDASGWFSFADVPETVDGGFYVDRPDGDGYQSWGNAFVAGAANHFVLQPGLLAASIWRTDRAGWDDWRWLRVETYGAGGGGTTWIDGEAGDAYAMPPDCGHAVAYPWDNQGIEWTPWDPLAVVAGARTPDVLQFDQDEGRGAWFAEPYWASGAPGTRTTVVLDNWPAGYEASFYGYSQAPSSGVKDWPFYVVADGSQYVGVDLFIPKTAPAGYAYEVHPYRYDDEASDLNLTLYFQVATLKPSRSSLPSGGSLTLRGTVPTQGRWGDASGKRKTVTVFQRTTAAGPPTAWDATKKGWKKAGTAKTDGAGVFRTSALRPRRTTWYVVRYPGDDWYYGAYTSVVKVTVE